MTLEDYTAKLRTLAQESSKLAVETIIVPAANELLADIKNRIVRDGKNSDGSKIGSYSTKPIYADKEVFVKKGAFKARGKTGERAFKSGALHKSMYLESGYKQLRDIQGRETAFINQEYSGATLLAYQMQPGDTYTLLGFTNEKVANIRKGNERRFGRIFSATQEEIDRYQKSVSEASAEITTKILNA